MREWADSAEADPGVALVDLLSYVGDLLSSYQDRVADEAFLGSAAAQPAGIRVEVDGERWYRRADLANSGPRDQHFTVVRQDDGGTAIQFGDGEHGRRPPADSEVRIRYRSGLGASGNRNRFAGVRLQEGRVVIDADWNQPDGDFCGIYRAVVTDAADPLLMRRVRVLVPEVTGEDSVWAMACLPLGASDEIPSAGDALWVAFESGDPDRPVWIGRLYSKT
jgi:Type VI secretion system/phage-baseplate injector OB domain